MEVFSLLPLPGQWFVTLVCAPRGKWVRRAIPVVPVPSGPVDRVPCLLSGGQQWAGQSKDGCDSLRQLLTCPQLALTCPPAGKGTQNCSLLLRAGAGAGRGQGAPWVHGLCHGLCQEWLQQGSCPHWLKGQLSGGRLHLRKLLPFC